MNNFCSNRFIRAHLKIRHLVLLVELGRHRSITRAAKAAHMPQPRASVVLSDLEQALGVSLFERDIRQTVPTYYGEVLIRRATAALAHLDAAYQEVHSLRAGVQGQVMIGTIPSCSFVMIPDAVKSLVSKHRRISVSVVVGTSDELVDRLRLNQLDIVVGYLPEQKRTNDLHFQGLGTERHCLVSGTDHPLLRVRQLDLDILGREGWIMPPTGNLLRKEIDAMFAAGGHAPPVDIVSTSDLAVAAELLTRGKMIAALPFELVRRHLESGKLAELPFALPLIMDTHGIITRLPTPLSPVVESMLEALRGAANPTFAP